MSVRVSVGVSMTATVRALGRAVLCRADAMCVGLLYSSMVFTNTYIGKYIYIHACLLGVTAYAFFSVAALVRHRKGALDSFVLPLQPEVIWGSAGSPYSGIFYSGMKLTQLNSNA